MSIEPQATPSIDPQRAFQLGMGAVSPLWPAYTAAAGAGLAFWWWNKMARGEHFDLLAEAASFAPFEAPVALKSVALQPTVEMVTKAADPIPAAVVAAPAEAVIETVAEAAPLLETVVELSAETVEAAIESAPEPELALEPVVEAAEAAQPIAEALVETQQAVVEAAPLPAFEPKPAVSRLDQSLAAWAATTPKTAPRPAAPTAPAAAAPQSTVKAAPKKTATKTAAKAKTTAKAAKKS